LPVVHPHGYLRLGGGPVTQLVLGEDDYFQHSRTPYAWPDVILIGYLSQSTCVFVGSSMTDPNVRRFLRLGRPVSSHRHFAFLPRSIDEVERDAMFRSLFDRDLEILGVRPIRFPLRTRENGVYSRIRELLDLLVTFNVDSEAIWRLVDSGPAT
ncbi:MAG: SIR2 family protein, partial [Candidatus Tectomicrobia bacterium]|nr:SIR2 family protein [Candidatus Tectomicrobia bacterium]